MRHGRHRHASDHTGLCVAESAFFTRRSTAGRTLSRRVRCHGSRHKGYSYTDDRIRHHIFHNCSHTYLSHSLYSRSRAPRLGSWATSQTLTDTQSHRPCRSHTWARLPRAWARGCHTHAHTHTSILSSRGPIVRTPSTGARRRRSTTAIVGGGCPRGWGVSGSPCRRSASSSLLVRLLLEAHHLAEVLQRQEGRVLEEGGAILGEALDKSPTDEAGEDGLRELGDAR